MACLVRRVDGVARLLQLLRVDPQVPLRRAQLGFQFVAVVGGDAEQDRQRVADRLRLELLVLAVEELVLVGDQPLLLEQVVERVLDVRVVAVAAVFERDIGAVLGNAEQARQQFDDAVVVGVDRQVLELWRLQLGAPSQHRRAATGAAAGRGRLGDQHLLVLELVDHGEPGHLVANDAFGDVERGASHAVFDDLGERRLAGGGRGR